GEEPQGEALPAARHDGRQRAGAVHPAGGGCADEGQQGLRPAVAAACAPWLRRGQLLRDAPALGLLREEPHRRRTAEGVRGQAAVLTASRVPQRTTAPQGAVVVPGLSAGPARTGSSSPRPTSAC